MSTAVIVKPQRAQPSAEVAAMLRSIPPGDLLSALRPLTARLIGYGFRPGGAQRRGVGSASPALTSPHS